MADAILTRGGPYRYNMSSLAKQEVYPDNVTASPERIAGEYQHGFFTAGNSFNPMFSVGQANTLTAEKTGVGDFIHLFKIPEFHTVVDVAARVFPIQHERGYPAKINTDGLVFALELRKYSQETLEQTGTVELVTDLSSIPANTAAFFRSAIKPTDGGYFVTEDEFLVLGLKVVSLPSDTTVSLADVTGRVEVTAHAWDYEAPIHV